MRSLEDQYVLKIQDDSNLVVYKVSDDTVAWSSNYHTHSYLSLAGGTLTGTISTRGIQPSTTATYSLGTTQYMWSGVCSKYFYSIGTDTGVYAQIYPATLGTKSTVGKAYVHVGNNTASGTAKNARGYLRLFGSSSGYTDIQTGYNSTSNITLTLPSKTGTIPIVSLSGTTLTITT